MARMRLIKEAYNYIKEQDPSTALKITGLTKLVKSGHIPCVKVGKKTLVNLDIIDKFLTEGMTTEETCAEVGIRSINENVRYI